MDLGLKGKIALVMGSSMGLGKAVAMELAGEGANLVICGRNETALEATKSEIELMGAGKVIAVVCDFKRHEQRKMLFDKAIEVFGQIDILVTNTGGPASGSFEEFDLEDWRDIYELLFIPVVDMIGHALPGMKERGFGRILSISSVAVKQPFDGLISSNAVRTSILGLIKSLSNEVAPYQVTVNNLMPGYTKTKRIKDLIDNAPASAQLFDLIPMGRYGEVREFAAAAAFLVSERASYITGQSLAVDGGYMKSS